MMSSSRAQIFERGFLVVEDVVPTALCEAVVDATADFLGIEPDDPAGWYGACRPGHGIVPLHHGQALWNVRQWPGVHALFRDLHEDEALWVSMDRVSFKVPAAGWAGGRPHQRHRSRRPDGRRVFLRGASPSRSPAEGSWPQPKPFQHGVGRHTSVIAQAREVRHPASPLHWDTDPRLPRRAEFQGLVYLRDTTDEQGAFCCAPEVYANLPEWVAHRSVAEARAAVNASDTPVRRIGGRAGSMVVWHRQMPHSSARNEAGLPRWVQYVTMDVAGDAAERLERVRLFEEKRPPGWAVRQEVPGQVIPEPGPVAELTPLGRRLVGLDAWTPRQAP